ncbi:MAG: winged helix-turn-helix domain-containing protein [Alcanivoracaceae bacterium]|nr:winged helix-turn-helix domain-containing protein [Alcanivoracaceae bacterium]
MNSLNHKQSFYLGSWFVSPGQNKLKNQQQEVFVEPKLMEVLTYLCIHAPDTISVNQLIENCWPNQVVTDSPLHKCITKIRKILGDSIKKPQYIKTVSKKGYMVVAEIRGLDNKVLTSSPIWKDGTPYRGLEQYDHFHQAIFFGRTKAVSEIKSLVKNSTEDHSTLLVVEGNSYVGKTSLIKTVVIPYLQTQNKQVKNDTCYHFDFSNCKGGYVVKPLVKYLVESELLYMESGIENFITGLRHKYQNKNSPDTFNLSKKHDIRIVFQKKIVFLDHIERAIFDQDKKNDDQIHLILMLINELVHSCGCFVVVAIRSLDFQKLKQFSIFQSMADNALHYYMSPPNSFEITEIVQQPIIATGYRYEVNEFSFEPLDQVIIDDARNIGNILPTLSYTLKDLCEHCNDKQQLTFERYHRIGKITGALTYKVNNILNTLSINEKKLFAQYLFHLIQYKPDKINEYVTCKADIQLFSGDDTLFKIVHYLLDQGLLQSHSLDKKIYVSILHDSILQECLFFRKWIIKNNFKLSALTEFKMLAKQWHINGQESDYLLYNKYLLNQVFRLVKGYEIELHSYQSKFLRLSQSKQSIRDKLKVSSIGVMAILLLFALILIKVNHDIKADLVTTNESAEGLITFMVGDLKDKLRPIGKLDLLEMVGKKIIDYYDNRVESIQSVRSQLQYNKALNTLGEADVTLGKLASAENLFEMAISKDLAIYKGVESQISALFSYSQSNYWLGYIYFLKNDFNRSQAYWTNYLDLTKKLVKLESDNDTWKLENSYALNNLGTLNFQHNNLEKAENYFSLSAKLKKQIIDHHPYNIEYLGELSDTISWQANIFDKRNMLIRANEMYAESLGIIQKIIYMDKGNKRWEHSLARANYRMALSYYDLGELNKMKYYLDQALPILIKLNNFDNGNQLWISDLINNYILLSKYHRSQKGFDNALLNLKRAIALYNSYSVESKKLKQPRLHKLYLIAEECLNFIGFGQHITALEVFEKAVNDFYKVDTSEYSDHIHIKAYTDFIMAKIKIAHNLNIQAKEHLQEALHTLNENISIKNNRANMALYIGITKMMGVSGQSEELQSYLKKINYKNPDFAP